MDIGRITSSGPVNITKVNQQTANVKQQVKLEQKKVKLSHPDLNETKRILNEATSNTRFSYSINEKIDSFIVKIIDRNTDKVVKEIPSQELQRLHENLKEAIGIFIDQMA